MVMEEGSKLAFLDVLVHQKENKVDTLSMERKPAQTATYIATLKHHPSQKLGIVASQPGG